MQISTTPYPVKQLDNPQCSSPVLDCALECRPSTPSYLIDDIAFPSQANPAQTFSLWARVYARSLAAVSDMKRSSPTASCRSTFCFEQAITGSAIGIEVRVAWSTVGPAMLCELKYVLFPLARHEIPYAQPQTARSNSRFVVVCICEHAT
jgi:hypothetical protein